MLSNISTFWQTVIGYGGAFLLAAALVYLLQEFGVQLVKWVGRQLAAVSTQNPSSAS